MCFLFSIFTLFYTILQNMSTIIVKNFVFLVIFDTCDVVYNWSISLFAMYLIIYLLESRLTAFVTKYSFKYIRDISFNSRVF